MKLYLKSILTGLSMFVCLNAFAQNIKARLLDSSNGEALPYATVYITADGAQKPSKYVLSTSEGQVLLEKVKKGAYTLKVELMGYKAFSLPVKMEGKNIDLGELKVDPDMQVLDAAKVSDIGNPIVVKKDTIEYNASSFKTSDNDMLIDLLKKLPGIEVESDGSITANGETIKKITIDGKTFFLDDPQLATKNIPSKIIEKVKVVEKKSEQALFTGIDDGEEETIIDLGIKKGMMKGWFGNIMAGGGHDVPSKNNDMNDWRYQGAGFIGNFTDKQQISVILNGNNTNNRGFNDLAGGMMGNMRGGGGGGMGRGGNGAGVTTSWMGGVNGSWDLLDDRMELAGNYLYNGSDKSIQEESTKNTYLNSNETLNYHNKGLNNTFSDGHRLGLRLDHKFSDNTSILFEPQFNIGKGHFSEYSKFDTDRDINGVNEMVNTGFNNNTGANKNWTASGRALLRQRLGKPGRTITVNLRYNFSKNNLNGINQSKTDAVTETSYVNQYYDQNSNNSQLMGGLSYTEPLWKNFYLEVNYNYTWREQKSNKDTYDILKNEPVTYDKDGNMHLPEQPRATQRNEVYSNDILNLSRNHRAGANIMYQNEKIRAQLGFNANPTYTYNKTSSRAKAYESNVINWAPQASISYEFNDNSNLRFFYNGRSNQPSTSQLVPVPDNSDPMNVRLGNPNLTPYFSHNARGMFRYTDKQTFMSINANISGGITENPIINTTWYDKTGAQFSLPTNGPSSGNVNMRLMINSPIAKSKFSIFNMLNVGYNQNSNYIANGQIDMSGYYIGGDKFNFDYDAFLKDYNDFLRDKEFSINKTHTMNFVERLRFTYRSDLVEVTLGGRTRMNKSWYTAKQNTNATWANQAEASMNWTIPGGVNLIADCNYNWYNGYTTPQESTVVLNAEITKLLFKDKVTLSLKGYDLLGQARTLSVTDNSNFHQETRNNTLGRYIILSVTFRFGTFNKGGMMGGPRGGRGPMRGPMGGPRR